MNRALAGSDQAAELRRRFRSTTPEQRLRQAFRASRFAARMRAAGIRAGARR
jgi:hypothetical protein